MLVLAHEALIQRERGRQAAPSTGLEGGGPAPVAGDSMPADGYRALVSRVRAIVGGVVVPGSRILIVSKGDDDLLVPGYDAVHFPQGPAGGYAGHYPADSDAAITHLEHCRAAGADHLVLPSTAYWWLDYYDGLARHLLTCGRVLNHDEHCLVVQLPSPPAEGTHP